MCDTCGCNITSGNEHLLHENGKFARTPGGTESVEVLRNLLHENDHQAGHNRMHFDQHGVLAINLMSSPGSGKTSLLEATIDRLGRSNRIGVIEGDLETERDAQRIRSRGIPAIQITTGNACHLDAHLVHEALHQFDLDDVDILFIENVGNLVCPASFDLGQHLDVTLLSVTEGDDKPAKYPVMFRQTDVMLISKVDLLPHLADFDPEQAELHLRRLSNPASVMRLSAQTGEGLDTWCRWLSEHVSQPLREGRRTTARVYA